MQQFIEKHRDQISGVLSGFDRLVFRGSLRRLNYLWQNKILFKNYRDHVQKVSERLKKSSLDPSSVE